MDKKPKPRNNLGDAQPGEEAKGDDVVYYISVKTNRELYHRIAEEARKQGVSLGEYMCRKVAEGLQCPELGWVPRKLQGRRPWKLSEQS